MRLIYLTYFLSSCCFSSTHGILCGCIEHWAICHYLIVQGQQGWSCRLLAEWAWVNAVCVSYQGNMQPWAFRTQAFFNILSIENLIITLKWSPMKLNGNMIPFFCIISTKWAHFLAKTISRNYYCLQPVSQISYNILWIFCCFMILTCLWCAIYKFYLWWLVSMAILHLPPFPQRWQSSTPWSVYLSYCSHIHTKPT